MTSTVPSQPGPIRAPLRPTLIVLLWFLLAVTSIWRLALAWNVLTSPAQGLAGMAVGQGAIVVHWRQLDLLIGWAALITWFLGASAGRGVLASSRLRDERFRHLFFIITAMGVFFAFLNAAADQVAGGTLARTLAYAGVLADLFLALAGILAVLRELHALAGEMPAGHVHLTPLWRLLTVQWLLFWIAAAVYLRFTQPREALLGNENARQMLFALPALGLLPNALMLAGIHTWQWLAKQGKVTGNPRWRAWLLAMIAVNIGALLLVLRPAWMGVFGSFAMLVGVVVYVAGFPRKSKGWSSWWHGIGWGSFAVALMMLGLERLLSLSSPGLSMAYFSNAWRHLVVMGFLLFAGVHLAVVTSKALCGGNLGKGAERLSGLGGWLVLGGVVLVCAILLVTSFRHGESHLGTLRWMFWALLLEALGMLVLGGFLLRAMRQARR